MKLEVAANPPLKFTDEPPFKLTVACRIGRLEADVMVCLTSGGSVAVCLAGIPDLVSVGYADIACIVADLAAPSNTPKLTASPTAQQNAAAWLKTQRITVQK